MGDRGVIRCQARLGDFCHVKGEHQNEIEESAEVYTHWGGSEESVREVLTEAARILGKKQQKEYSGWEQDHFVADPNRVITLIALAAERVGTEPEIYPPHKSPWPDRPDYVVETTPKGWFVEGGNFEKRYRITPKGLEPVGEPAKDYLHEWHQKQLERMKAAGIPQKSVDEYKELLQKIESER